MRIKACCRPLHLPYPRRPLSNIPQQAAGLSHHTSLFRPQIPQLALQTGDKSCGPYSTFPYSPKRLFSSKTSNNEKPRDEQGKMTDVNVESAKRAAGFQAVNENFDPSAAYVGIGSGTTIVYVVDAIKEKSTNPNIRFVPTGYQSRQVIIAAGLTPIAFDSLQENVRLDIAFDGADEVDEELNCIKGGGACLFQEKLVAERARKFVCVADYRKKQARLLTNWPTIPIEVAPISVPTVLHSLKTLGSTNPKLRTTLLAKSGPLKTDQDFFIIDAPFPKLLTEGDVRAGQGKGDGSDGTWEVGKLAHAIKDLTGVLEVGIFSGLNGPEAEAVAAKKGGSASVTGGQKPVAVYFGMQDGSVEVRKAT